MLDQQLSHVRREIGEARWKELFPDPVLDEELTL